MINYIVYGNTDYLDVLKIQTDYIFGDKHLTLFINTNNKDLEKLYEKYDRVIFYDDTQSYPDRISSCLKKVDYEYFVFTHDIDILLSVNKKTINKLHNFLKYHNFDRIDLKYCDKFDNNSLIIEYSDDKNVDNWDRGVNHKNIGDGLFLIKQDDVNNYIYNVNPSIWKRETMITIFDKFKEKNYRTIEELDVQIFSKKYVIFKLFSKNYLNCGYFKCLDLYKFLHITHNGKFLPLNENYTTVYGQSYYDIKDEYLEIVNKYNLKNTTKWIN
jgi:hypothetical protein